MSIIDLLRSPLAIAGIVGSVAIGGGLTVYVVRDGALPGQSAPAVDAFPGVFGVQVNYVHIRDDNSKREMELPIVRETRFPGFENSAYGHKVYVSDSALHKCNLLIDRAKGCQLVLHRFVEPITIRLDDLSPTVSIRHDGQTGVYMFENVTWEDFKKGLVYGEMTLRAQGGGRGN